LRFSAWTFSLPTELFDFLSTFPFPDRSFRFPTGILLCGPNFYFSDQTFQFPTELFESGFNFYFSSATITPPVGRRNGALGAFSSISTESPRLDVPVLGSLSRFSEIPVTRPLRTATRRSWQPGGFGDSCLPDGIFHGALDYRFVEVMPTPDAGLAVDIHHEEARSRGRVGVE
jgi:hypothetical protein